MHYRTKEYMHNQEWSWAESMLFDWFGFFPVMVVVKRYVKRIICEFSPKQIYF